MQVEAVDVLLQNGASMETYDNNIYIDAVDLLLKTGEHELKRGAKPNVNMLAVFFKFGSDVDEKNENGSTALHRACRAADKKLVSFLLQHRAAIDSTDRVIILRITCMLI
jgi:ankyrin repeat protein